MSDPSKKAERFLTPNEQDMAYYHQAIKEEDYRTARVLLMSLIRSLPASRFEKFLGDSYDREYRAGAAGE